RVSQTSGKADPGPAAYTGQYSDVLLATVLVGHHVADDARWRLELVQFLAGLGINRLQIAFQRAVEHDTARRGQGTRPHREQLRIGPDDLAGLAVPGNEVAHIGLASRREHRQGRPDIRLARRVAHSDRLVIHADVVGRHVEQLGLRRIGRRLLVLRSQRRRADAGGVVILAARLGRVFRHDRWPTVVRRVLVHVDAGGPVDLRIVLFGNQKLTGLAVQRVAETVAIKVGQ